MHSFSILRIWSRIGFDGCFRVERLVRNGVVAISCPVVTHGSAMSDAIEPNAEALCLAQRADTTKGFDPNLLHDVPSVLVSLNQAPHVIKHRPFELPHDFLESLVVAALGSYDEQFPIKLPYSLSGVVFIDHSVCIVASGCEPVQSFGSLKCALT